jgi:hypothetical protein
MVKPKWTKVKGYESFDDKKMLRRLCMYVYIFACTCVYMSTYVYRYMSTYVYRYMSTYVYTCLHMCICVYIICIMYKPLYL